MSDKERGIQISRRRLLQIPAARSVNKVAGFGRVAEFVAQHPDQALSAAQRFAEASLEIFKPTVQPKKSDGLMLSPKDRAIKTVAEILQTTRFDPDGVIESIADFLVVAQAFGNFYLLTR